MKLTRLLLPTFAAAAAVSCALALQALAAVPSATVTWTPPAQYTDNTTLPATDIASYTVSACRAGTVPPCLTFQTPAVPAGTAPATSIVVPLTCGDYILQVLATTTATAKYPNESSAYTNPIPYATQVSCAPNPPTGVTVAPATTG